MKWKMPHTQLSTANYQNIIRRSQFLSVFLFFAVFLTGTLTLPQSNASAQQSPAQLSTKWCADYKKDHPGARNRWNDTKNADGSKAKNPLVKTKPNTMKQPPESVNEWDTETCKKWWQGGYDSKGATCKNTSNPHNKNACNNGKSKNTPSSGSTSGSGSSSGSGGGSGASGGSSGSSGGGGSSDSSSASTDPFGKNTKLTSSDTKKDPAYEDCQINRDKCDIIGKFINPIIGFLAAFVAIAVTIGIVSGGIRYASAGDDSSKIASGKKQIFGALVALIAFIGLYATIQWLSPGA